VQGERERERERDHMLALESGHDRVCLYSCEYIARPDSKALTSVLDFGCTFYMLIEYNNTILFAAKIGQPYIYIYIYRERERERET
jgi:hypothetical protein